MSITTKSGANVLSLREIQSVAPILFSTRNSKGRPVALHMDGPPGGGKTMITEAVAWRAALSHPGRAFGYGISNVSISTPADIAGFTLFESQRIAYVDETGTNVEYERKVSRFTVPTLFAFNRVYIADSDGNLESVTHDDFGQPLYVGSVVRGKPVVHGLILLDEFLQADVENRKVCAPVLDEGRIATHYLPPGVAVWAASNRAADRSGVGKALAFLTNRECKISLRSDMNGFMAFAEGRADSLPVENLDPMAPVDPITGRANGRMGWHPAMLAYCRQNESLLEAGVPNDPGSPFLTKRSVHLTANLFDQFMVDAQDVPVTYSTDASRARIFTALASGIIGDDNAAQLNTTIALFDEIPTIPEIMANPRGAKVSDKKDAQLIVSYMLSNAMDGKNGEALIGYLKRLGDAFCKNAMVNAATRNGALIGLPSMAAMFDKDPTAVQRMLMARTTADNIARARAKAGARAR